LLISIPGGLWVARMGYQRGIIGGLLLAASGCALFYPAAEFRLFPLFLLALFVLASGITILQVAANPYVAVLGPEDKAASRLNLAQAFNSLGTTIAPIFSATYLLSDSILNTEDIAAMDAAARNTYYISEASAVQSPFLYIAMTLALIALAFGKIKLPKLLGHSSTKGLKEAWRLRKVKTGVAAIFLYVGAEVAIGSYLISYFLYMNLDDLILNSPGLKSIAQFVVETFSGSEIANLDGKAIVGAFVIFYWGGAMLGRFVGFYLTRVFRPYRVLTIFGFLAISCLAITMSSAGLLAMWTVLAVGFFNSIMFPTIFTNTLDSLEDLKPQISGLLCTAIFGGAIIPPLFGAIIDGFGFKVAFVLPIICYLYISIVALRKENLDKA
jgi:FHS family L-fucose permease-like MFS transporter